MAKFLFYVVDLEEGTVTGSNNVETVEQFVENDQYTVIHAQSGVYWLGSRKENNVEGIADPEDNVDETGDENEN